MDKLLYSNIEFVYNLTDPKSETARLGFVAEWFDGDYWHIGLCAATRLAEHEAAQMDESNRSFLSNPFTMLFVSIDRIFRLKPPTQEGYCLPKLLVKLFPNYMPAQATTLFECAVGEGQTPEEVFEELVEGFSKEKRQARWYHLPERTPSEVFGSPIQ